jgi:hypothetical protein
MNEALDLTMPGADAAMRRCALTLHAIGAHDREWLLTKLPADRGDELERLVEELQSLGIPADPCLAREALKHDRRPRAPVTGAEAPHTAQAAQLAQVLQQEQPAVIAHILALRVESADAVLGHLGAPKRRQVQELLLTPRARSAATLAPRLSQALLEQLSIRLLQASTQPIPADMHRAAKRWRPTWRDLARMRS